MAGYGATGGFDAAAHAQVAAPARPSELTPMSAVPTPEILPLLPTPSPTPKASVGTLQATLAGPPPSTNPDTVLAAKLDGLTASTSASVSVAVTDLDGGSRARYGVQAGRTYDTASIVKVDILATLLLKAQDEHRALTTSEKSYAASMIRMSDNASTDVLWGRIGGSAALNAANRRLGLTGTTAGSGGLWGLTQTTAPDQLVLLAAVFGTDSPLTASSRTYARGLMAHIAAGQDWGVSAAGTAIGLKNGWLPRSATGLWDVNSVGLVSVSGQDRLVAVLSKGNTSMEAGISLVEKAAKAATEAVRDSATVG